MKGIKVEIDGMNFYVVGTSDEDRVQEMAKDLTSRIQETAASNFRLNQVQGLVLTSLNLMDELYSAKEETKKLTDHDPDLESLRLLESEKKDLEDKLKAAQADKKAWNEKWTAFTEEKKDLQDQLKTQDKDLKKLDEEKQGLVDQVRNLEQEIKVLEDKVYQDQMTMVDLQKEISILNGSEED